MAGVLAAAGTSGIGVSAARACDHGPALGYGPGPRWGYGGVATTTVRFGVLPDYDDCSVCRRIRYVPPACPPPPCEEEFDTVGEYRRVSRRDYRRTALTVTYPAPPALYATPRRVPSYEESYYPETSVPPTKQPPAVYATPQYPDPTSGPSASYAVPRAPALDPSEAPPAGYDQVPPPPTPSLPRR